MRVQGISALAICLFFAPSAFAVQPTQTNLETDHFLHEYKQVERVDLGDGQFVEWDLKTETAARLYGVEIPFVLSATEATRDEIVLRARDVMPTFEPFAGVSADRLQLTKATFAQGTWFIQFDRRTAEGIRVDLASAELRVKNGQIVMAKFDSHPGADAVSGAHSLTVLDAFDIAGAAFNKYVITPDSELVVVPIANAEGYTYHLAWRVIVETASPVGRWLTHVDAGTGEILRRENEIRFLDGKVGIRVEPRTVGDTMVDFPAAFLDLGVATTGSNGVYEADAGTASFGMSGTYVNVNNTQNSDLSASFPVGEDYVVTDADGSQAELAAYVHTNIVKEWARQAAPDLGWVNNTLTVNVNLSGSCNAFWNGSTTNFYRESNQCNNIARISDVVYHEFGHGFHQNIRESGQINGAIGEGSSDYVSISITQDPLMAPGFFKNGDGIRNADNTKMYPDDLVGQVHADGEIWVGAMWNLMLLLQERYGDIKGRQVSDVIFADVLRTGPTLSDVYAEALAADDGTHHCEIHEAFTKKGFANQSGTPSFIHIVHDDLVSRHDPREVLPVSVTLAAGSQCAIDSADSAVLRWRQRGGSYTDVAMTGSGANWSADIPAQDKDGAIEYYIEATGAGVTDTNPPVAQENVHRVWVGEVSVVFEDDFETDQGWTHGGDDDWQLGSPLGKGADPQTAFSGDNAWGNDLGIDGFNGNYQNDVTNYLVSPEINCSSCVGTRMQFRRWLSLDDDVARIYVNDEIVWEHSGAIQDRHWSFEDIDISAVADMTTIRVKFELVSGASGQSGGWTLDDFSIVTPIPSVDPGSEKDQFNPGWAFGVSGDGRGCSCAITKDRNVPSATWLTLALLGVVLVAVRRRQRA